MLQTIIVKIPLKKLTYSGLDLRYVLPERAAQISNNQIQDNGYDFLPGGELGIWMSTADAAQNVAIVIQLLKTEQFFNNDLSQAAEVYISDKNTAKLEDCTQIFPAL